jgi:thymidylate synthase
MHKIYSKSAGYAWVDAVRFVMKNGDYVKDGDITLKEVLDLFVEVEDGQLHDEIIDIYADSEMIDWMVNKNFGGHEPVLDWGYCYGMRFYDFNGVDQIAEIVKKLQSNPEAKSATITLMKPEDDFTGHMPCITTLDAKIRNDKLHLTGFFRSQDIGKKFYADILALGSIQKTIADQLCIESGHVKIFISSAHIYETEFDKLEHIGLQENYN